MKTDLLTGLKTFTIKKEPVGYSLTVHFDSIPIYEFIYKLRQRLIREANRRKK